MQLIYSFIQNNPSSFKLIIRAISKRVLHTRTGTVALKCLMLLHGLFLAGISAADSIGRLPFDLSDFGKLISRLCVYSRLFLVSRYKIDLFFHGKKNLRLEIIVKMQRIVDSLIRIKPIGESPLVNESMEYVISEILQISSKFADYLSDSQSNISPEAELVMKIVKKSLSQREEIFRYFEFCRDFGVTTELDELIYNFPVLEQITTETDFEIIEDDDDNSSELISF